MEATLAKSQMICALCLLLGATIISGYPTPNIDEAPEGDERQGWRREAKKADVFMSRGWGAGGMPFNVLYTQQPKLTRGPPISTVPLLDVAPYLTEPQALRSVRQESPPATPLKYTPTRKQYSVIPQLFVSYGWGPIGK